MKEYTDKQINSMIRHLKVKDIAEIYYLDRMQPRFSKEDQGDLKFYDYKTNSWINLKELCASAIETGWKDKKEK